MWTRDVQDVIFAILMCSWLGGLSMKDEPAEAGKLLTIEEVGEILDSESDSSCSNMRDDRKMIDLTSFYLQNRQSAAKQDWDFHTLCSHIADHVAVPVNLKDRDAFHITIEEYLQSLITLIEELARLAINSVTLGDYKRPLQISKFVKDLHAGFQILNLKNDSLRRRSDSIKYNVKKIEDVVYDLSLRNLIPTEAESST
jgi:Translin family